MPTINNKIHQRGHYELLEQTAAAVILPGMVIETLAAGTVQPHSTAGGYGEKTIAQEDSLLGNTTVTPYNIGDQVRIAHEGPGSISLLLLTAGFNYPIGTKVISNGDGTAKPTTGTPATVFGVVIQAVNLTAGGSVNTLAQCRI
jgi:hypothetical protein